MNFFTHAECCIFFFSNKLAAPKLHDRVIKEPTAVSLSSAIFTKVGFSLGGFLGKSTTKSGRARVVEFSQNQTCRRPGRRPETRTLYLVGSGPVRFGSVRVRVVEFGHYYHKYRATHSVAR